MPMWVFDAETIGFLKVNDAAVRNYGYSRETFLGMKLREIWPQEEWVSHSQSLAALGDTLPFRARYWRHLKADGGEIEVLTFGRRVAFEGRDGYLVAVIDITERRKAEARIAYMAHHDGLTNLPNRELYQERLKQALEAAARQPARRGLVRRSRPVQERQRFVRPPDRRSPAAAGGRPAARRRCAATIWRRGSAATSSRSS